MRCNAQSPIPPEFLRTQDSLLIVCCAVLLHRCAIVLTPALRTCFLANLALGSRRTRATTRRRCGRWRRSGRSGPPRPRPHGASGSGWWRRTADGPSRSSWSAPWPSSAGASRSRSSNSPRRPRACYGGKRTPSARGRTKRRRGGCRPRRRSCTNGPSTRWATPGRSLRRARAHARTARPPAPWYGGVHGSQACG